mgnify:CR=1 FL=1
MAIRRYRTHAHNPYSTAIAMLSTTPAMHCEGCENKIKKNIRFVKGTKKIETSVPNQTVTIVYDGRKTTYADYESAFKKIGYSVKKVKK